jgi:cyclopropane-fatty-acyl-phospholipid synthase
MWEFYLAGGIVMFESGAACNYQVQYIRERNALPITRDYMLETERRYRELADRKEPRGSADQEAPPPRRVAARSPSPATAGQD